MQICDELLKKLFGELAPRCIVVPRGGGYFTGVKAIGDLSSERIVLYFPRESVEIVGENLSIGKYYDGDAYLSGRIFSLAVLEKADEKPHERGG